MLGLLFKIQQQSDAIMRCIQDRRFFLYSSPILMLTGLIITFVGYLDAIPAHGECSPDMCNRREKEPRSNQAPSRVIGPVILGISVLFFLISKCITLRNELQRQRRRSGSSPNGNRGLDQQGYIIGSMTPPPSYRKALSMKKPAILPSSSLSLPQEPPPLYDTVMNINPSCYTPTHPSPESNPGDSESEHHIRDEVVLNVPPTSCR